MLIPPNQPPKRSNRRQRSKSSEDTALSVALRYIKSRPRSSFEVAKRLDQSKYPSEEVNSVIGQLTEVGIIDDRRFARDWLRWRDRFHPQGRWLLERELKEKGITESLIEEILEARESREWQEEIGISDPLPEGISSNTDARLVWEIVQKQKDKLLALPWEKRQAKLAGLLGRRGFAPDLVYTALKWLENPA